MIRGGGHAWGREGADGSGRCQVGQEDKSRGDGQQRVMSNRLDRRDNGRQAAPASRAALCLVAGATSCYSWADEGMA